MGIITSSLFSQTESVDPSPSSTPSPDETLLARQAPQDQEHHDNFYVAKYTPRPLTASQISDDAWRFCEDVYTFSEHIFATGYHEVRVRFDKTCGNTPTYRQLFRAVRHAKFHWQFLPKEYMLQVYPRFLRPEDRTNHILFIQTSGCRRCHNIQNLTCNKATGEVVCWPCISEENKDNKNNEEEDKHKDDKKKSASQTTDSKDTTQDGRTNATDITVKQSLPPLPPLPQTDVKQPQSEDDFQRVFIRLLRLTKLFHGFGEDIDTDTVLKKESDLLHIKNLEFFDKVNYKGAVWRIIGAYETPQKQMSIEMFSKERNMATSVTFGEHDFEIVKKT